MPRSITLNKTCKINAESQIRGVKSQLATSSPAAAGSCNRNRIFISLLRRRFRVLSSKNCHWHRNIPIRQCIFFKYLRFIENMWQRSFSADINQNLVVLCILNIYFLCMIFQVTFSILLSACADIMIYLIDMQYVLILIAYILLVLENIVNLSSSLFYLFII